MCSCRPLKMCGLLGSRTKIKLLTRLGDFRYKSPHLISWPPPLDTSSTPQILNTRSFLVRVLIRARKPLGGLCIAFDRIPISRFSQPETVQESTVLHASTNLGQQLVNSKSVRRLQVLENLAPQGAGLCKSVRNKSAIRPESFRETAHRIL